jgi:hypothetical protein
MLAAWRGILNLWAHEDVMLTCAMHWNRILFQHFAPTMETRLRPDSVQHGGVIAARRDQAWTRLA